MTPNSIKEEFTFKVKDLVMCMEKELKINASSIEEAVKLVETLYPSCILLPKERQSPNGSSKV